MVRLTPSSAFICKPPSRWALASSITAVLLSPAFLMTPIAASAQNAWKGESSNEITDPDNWGQDVSNGELGDAVINGGTPNAPVWTLGKTPVGAGFDSEQLWLDSLSIGVGAGSNGQLTVNTVLDDDWNDGRIYLDGNALMPLQVGSNGGTGTLEFNLFNHDAQTGTHLDIRVSDQYGFAVGTDGGSGTVTVNGKGNSTAAQGEPGANDTSPGSIEIYGASHVVGSQGGNGTFNLVDAVMNLHSSGHDQDTGEPLGPILSLGSGTGSVGTFNILAGGKLGLALETSELEPAPLVGGAGGTGTLTVSGRNADGYASTATINGGLDVGVGMGSVGTINLLAGGKMLSQSHADLYDPATGEEADPIPARIGVDGGTGTATVAGQGSIWYVAGASSFDSSWHINHDDPEESYKELQAPDDGTQIGHLHVGVSGTGSLSIADGGVVTLGTAYTGEISEERAGDYSYYWGLIQFDDGLGTLFLGETVSGNGSLNIGAAAGTAAAGAGELRAAQVQFGPGAGTVVFNHTANDYIFRTPLVGEGVLANHAGTTWLQPILPLPSSVAVDNRDFSGITELHGGVLGLGYALALGSSAVQVKADAGLAYADAISVANSIDLQGAATLATSVADGGSATQAGVISGSGNLAKTEVGTLQLSAVNTYTGQTVISGGTLALVGAGSIAQSSRVLADALFDISAASSPVSIRRLAGSGTVNTGSQSLSLTAAADTFAGNLAGAGSFNVLAGKQVLTGNSSAFAGNSNVLGGQLWVNGVLGAAGTLATVANGGLLGGDGRIGGSLVVNDGGVLVPGAEEAIPGELTIDGDLTLAPGAAMHFLFGQAGVAGGAFNDLISVGGNLVLDGTLDVALASGGLLEPGVYRVIDYAGTLDDRGLDLGVLPPELTTSTVQTSVDQQINLVLAPSGVTLSFWDGAAGPKNDGDINGGDGIWQAATGNDNWTDANGLLNAPFADASFAVFSGMPGTVTVDDGLGAIRVDGMQFSSSGYVLGGDAVELLGPDALIRVGNGTNNRNDYLSPVVEHVATIDSVLGGDARLVKSDAGTLVLNGQNTYSSGTFIRDGVVQISSDQALGATNGTLEFGFGALRSTASMESARSINIQRGATLLPADGTALTLSGALSGSGALIKGGSGRLHLTGTSSLSGATTVAAGVLQVDGELANSAVSIERDALLAGNGTVGATVVRDGASISPGNSIGQLTINGDYQQQAGGRYLVEVDPGSTASDLLAVNGAASLATGALLEVARSNDALYRLGTRYTVLNAQGGVSGQYTLRGDVALSPFLALTDIYDANHVYLEVQRTGSITNVNCTPNGNAAAGGAAGLAQDGDLVTALYNQNSEAAVCDALGQLSGEIHASLRGAQLEDSRFIREAIGNRVRGAGIDAADPQLNDGAWAHVFGSWGRFEHGHDTAALDRDIDGLFIGADKSLSDHWRIGAAVGYSRSDMDVNRWRSSADSDDKHLALYSGWQWDNGFGFNAGLAYAWHDVEVERQVEFTHFNDRLRTDYKASTRQAFTELHYRMQMAGMALYPFVNVAYVELDSDGFTEHGGEAALQAGSQSHALTFATLGARTHKLITFASGGNLTLRAMTGWRHVFGDRSPDVALGFVSGGNFRVAGVPLARQTLAAELGVETTLRDNLRLGLTYSGQMGGGIDDHGGKAFVEWKF